MLGAGSVELAWDDDLTYVMKDDAGTHELRVEGHPELFGFGQELIAGFSNQIDVSKQTRWRAEIS